MHRLFAVSRRRVRRVSLVATSLIIVAAGGWSHLAGAADVTGPIVAGGAPVSVTTTSAGDNIRLTFTGTVGQRVSVKLSSVTIGTSGCCSTRLSILKPDGSTLGGSSNWVYAGTSGGYLDVQSLTIAGTYTVLVDPEGTAIGSATVTLYDVPADPAPSMTPTAGAGTAVAFTVSTPGQALRPTFTGTVGQRVSVKLSGVTIGTSGCCSVRLSILKPDGSTLGGSSNWVYAGTSGGYLEVQTLPSTDTYTVLVDPEGSATGNATVTLYDVPADPAPSMTPTSGAGTAVAFTVTTPGLNLRPTFTGTVGQRISVKLSSVTIGTSGCCSVRLSILKPDGSILGGSSNWVYAGTSGGFLDIQTLTIAGSYTVLVDPESSASGNATVTLYDVPAAPTGAVAVGGAALHLASTTPGQNVRPTFTGQGVETVRVTLSSVTIGTSGCCSTRLSILKPDGSTLGGSSNWVYIGTSGGTFTATVPADGTYTVLVDSESFGVGGVTFALVRTGAYLPLPQARSACIGLDFLSPCATAKDPVNTLTGAFTSAVTDVSLPGTGVGFELTRSYDSSDPTQGRLGPGWADSFSTSLTIETNGDAVIHSENGQQGRFLKQADGSFVGSAGARSTLTAITGGYELVRHDQSRFRFNTQGRLSSKKDQNDQGLTLTYATDGKLQSVTDSAARSFGFSHNAQGLLAQVSLPDGRNVSYAYTSGRLTSVTDLRGGTITYRYDGAGRLDKVTDQSGRVEAENTYGADGRVTSQLDGLGNNTTFAWAAATQTATITDPRGNVWKDVYSNNVLLKRIDALGNETVLSHNVSLDQTAATSPGGEATTMSYDSRGNLTQAVAPASLQSATKTIAYNAQNYPTSVTDARGKVTSYGYDSAGNNTTVTQDGQTVGSNLYDSAGRETSSTDGRGNPTTYTYDANGNLASETDPLGNKTTYAYDSAGEMLSRVDPLGNVVGGNPNDYRWSWTYDAAGRLLTENDPLGNTKTSTYDDAGNKLTENDANNKTTTYVYDAANRLTSATAPDGGVTAYTYDAVGNKLTEIDPRNNTTTYTYDANNRLASVTTPLGSKTSYSYDLNGNQTKVIEPRGHVAGANPDDYATVSTYDAAGRLLSKTNSLGQSTTYTYDKVGNRLSVTDPRGKVTTNTYDGRNRLVSVTAPDGGVTSYTYDANGNQLTRTNPRGKVWTNTYDLANRLASSTTPLGSKTTHLYDANGRETKVVEPRGNVTGANPDDYAAVSTYDRAGRLLNTTDPLGNQTQYTYDGVGNKLSLTDAADRTTSYTYDSVNRLASVIAADLTTTSYTYDLAGSLTRRTDANNHATDYAYDADGRRTTVISPIGQTWTTSFDAAGNVTQIVDANGNATQTAGDGTTTNTYDRTGRLTGTDYSDSTPDVTFAYDAAGNRTTMTDGAGTETRAYDNANRLTNVTRGADTFAYTYDAAGDLTRRTYPDSTVTDYTFDDDSRMATVTSGGAITSYAYDAAGNLTTTTLPASNGQVETRTYDRSSRLTRIGSAKAGITLVDFAYTFDPVGNPMQVDRTGSFAGITTFTYDNRHRLTETCYAASCTGASDYIHWAYDAVGNRLSESRPSGTTAYSYNAGDQLTEAGSISYSYDASGNQTAAGPRAFTYDLGGRITSTTAGGTTSSYSYDGDGNRRQSITGTQVVNYTWDSNHNLPQLALERDGGSELLRRYLYGTQRLSMASAAQSSYYHYDHLGSVAGLTSASGSLQRSYSYEPFGVTRSESNEPAAPENVHKFAGELQDPTGLYYLRARQYDASIGRLLRPDPVEQSLRSPFSASYAYATGNPLAFVDPSGMTAVPATTALRAMNVATSPGGTRADGGSAPPSYERFDAALSYIYGEMRTNARSWIVNAIGDYRNESWLKRAAWYANPNRLAIKAAASAVWVNNLRPGGDWDHKPKLARRLALDPPGTTRDDYYFPIRGERRYEVYYDIWSNIHYGYVGGAAGFSEWALQTAARFEGRNDEGDKISTRIGARLWANFGRSLTPGDLHGAILSAIPLFEQAQRRDPDLGVLLPAKNGNNR